MIYNIQILRALAAMMVVCHHAIGQMETRGGRVLGFDATVGMAGVDIFFVISGFIMTYVTLSSPKTVTGFWKDRIYRIVPLYWFYTILMVLILFLFPNYLKTAQFDTVHIIKSLLFIPSPHPRFEDQTWPLLVQGWTLNFEMFFYFIFGVLLMIKSEKWHIFTLSALIGGLVAMGFILEPTHVLGRVYTSPLLLEFLAGVFIGHAHVKNWLPGRMGGILCFFAGLSLFILTAINHDWGSERVLVWGVPSVLIVVAALCLEGTAYRNSSFQLLGNASYSIYLSHTFTLGIIGVVWSRIGNGSLLFDVAMFSISLVGSMLVGILSYGFLEAPIARAFSRRREAD